MAETPPFVVAPYLRRSLARFSQYFNRVAQLSALDATASWGEDTIGNTGETGSKAFPP